MKLKLKFFKILAFLIVLIIVSTTLLQCLGTLKNRNAYPEFLEYSYVNLVENLVIQNSLKDDFQKEQTGLKEFYQIHQKNLNSIKPRISFNQAQPEGGYANRLFSFLSSLLASILTDSALIVYWPHINYFIKPPINIFIHSTSYLFIEPNNSKLQVFTLKARQPWVVNKNVNLLQNTKIPINFSRYNNYESMDAQFMEVCLNPFYYQKLITYDLISNETIQMEKNKLAIGFLVGGELLNKIWLPNDDLKRKIQFYLDEYFAKNYVIGFQLRYGDPNLPYLNEQIDTIKFINCAIKIERDHFEKFKKSNKLYKTKQSIKWFISTDSQVNSDKLLRKYSSKAFSTQGTIAHVSKDPNGYERAIIDHELLSKADELIITGASTYGFTAAMKSKRLPYFIDGFYSKSHRECMRINLSDSPQTPLGSGLF